MSHDTAQLAALIDAKHTCLRQLHELGLRQLESIEGGDLTQLMKVLAAKQRLLAMLPELEQRLDPFRAQAPADRSWASPQERTRCATAQQNCEQLLNQIVLQEKQSEELLSRQRSDAANRLHMSNNASQARSSYTVAGDYTASQLDLCSEQ